MGQGLDRFGLANIAWLQIGRFEFHAGQKTAPRKETQESKLPIP
jgi:hypothetical protein